MTPNSAAGPTSLYLSDQILTADPYMVEFILLITRPYYNERRDADTDTGRQQIIHDSACSAALKDLPKTHRGVSTWLSKKLKNRYSTSIPMPDDHQYVRAKYLLKQSVDAERDIIIKYE